MRKALTGLRFFVSVSIAAGVMTAADSGLAAETTPTLFSVTVAAQSGQNVPGAEVMVLPTSESGTALMPGKWKPISSEGAVSFLADEVTTVTTFFEEPVPQFFVIAGAPGFAPKIELIPAPKFETGVPEAAGINLTLEKGREVTVQLVPPDGQELPDNLQPWIVPDKMLRATWLSLQEDVRQSGEPVNVALASQDVDGNYMFHVADDTPELYLMINHPGFLRVWQSEAALKLDSPGTRPVVVQVPNPATAKVTFKNPYTHSISEDAQVCLLVESTGERPGGGITAEAFRVCNAGGVREWTLTDLAPGKYIFSVDEGTVESVKSTEQNLLPGGEASVTLGAHPVIPALVALDETGTTIPDAEAQIYGTSREDVNTYRWEKAKNGVIVFKQNRISRAIDMREPVKEFTVELRAPGYALTTVQLEAGAPLPEPQKVEMQRGRTVKVVFKPDNSRPVPGDLNPLAIAEKDFPRAFSYLNHPEVGRSLGIGRYVGNNSYEFQLADDLESFRIGFYDEDYIRNFWTEPLKDFADGEVEVPIPAVGALQADITLTSPPLQGDITDPSQKYIVWLTGSVTEPNASRSWQITYGSRSINESTSTVFSNLPPGEYDVHVRSGNRFVRSAQETKFSVNPGSTVTLAIKVDPPGPMDESGRELVQFPSIKVIDINGSPVPAAQAVAFKKGTRFLPVLEWQSATAGGVIKPQVQAFHGETSDGNYSITVRASGYLTTEAGIDLPTSKTAVEVRLKQGTEVVVKLESADDQAIPAELRPALFPEKWGRDVWLSTSPERTGKYAPETLLSPIAVKAAGDGRFIAQIDAGSTEPLYMLINHPGFLRAFQAGPFDPAEWATSRTVAVSLPEPATLTAMFEYEENEKPESSVVTMEINRSQKVPGQNTWGLGLVSEELPLTSATLTADDLASGSYSVEVKTSPKGVFRQGVYSTRESAKLDAGDSKTLTLQYRPFKKDWLQGPYTAVVTVRNQTGELAAGKAYKVTWHSSGYPQQTIAEGNIPADGVIRLERLAGVEKEMTREDYEKRGYNLSFDVEVDGQRLGSIAFMEYRDGKYYPPDEGKTKEYNFNVPPKEGDVAPDFAMVDIKTSETMRLSDLKGQVVLIDFWATWCGPCQGPMAENQDIMRRHGDEWKGKATILALSIDDELETVRKHLDKNEWHETHNAWASPAADNPDNTGWESPAAGLYGIGSIPTMVLIDKDGIIKKRGHMPELEKEIEALLE